MKKIDTYIALSQEEIQHDYENIKQEYETYLKPHGLVLPGRATNAMYQLIYLYHFQGIPIHKDAISNFVISQNPKASGDQQIRHLGAQKGFYVLYNGATYNDIKVNRGYYCLITLKQPLPSWENRQNARSITASTSDFETLKKNFGYRCATCGEKEGTIHRYSGKVVVLQQGHCHPDKPLEAGNIIPQCEYCNQNVYKNDFIFTLEGRPHSIYNPNYVLKSDLATQKAIFNLLKQKFESEE